MSEPVDPQHLIRDALDVMGREVRSLNNQKGWRSLGSSFPEYLVLLHSEISEALEAFRRKAIGVRWVSENGKPEGVGPELADVLIRLIDTCDRFGIDLAAEYRAKMDHNWTRPFRHGGKVL